MKPLYLVVKTQKPILEDSLFKSVDAPSASISAATPSYKYCSLQVDLPRPLAEHLKEWAKTHVPPFWRDESHDGGSVERGLENNPHITVCFGLDEKHHNAVARIVAEAKPPLCVLGPLSVFEGEDGDVLVASVYSLELPPLHARLREYSMVAARRRYTPHVTVAYLKKGFGRAFLGLAPFAGDEVRFPFASWSDRNGEVEPMPFSTNASRMLARILAAPNGLAAPNDAPPHLAKSQLLKSQISLFDSPESDSKLKGARRVGGTGKAHRGSHWLGVRVRVPKPNAPKIEARPEEKSSLGVRLPRNEPSGNEPLVETPEVRVLDVVNFDHGGKARTGLVQGLSKSYANVAVPGYGSVMVARESVSPTSRPDFHFEPREYSRTTPALGTVVDMQAGVYEGQAKKTTWRARLVDDTGETLLLEVPAGRRVRTMAVPRSAMIGPHVVGQFSTENGRTSQRAVVPESVQFAGYDALAESEWFEQNRAWLERNARALVARRGLTVDAADELIGAGVEGALTTLRHWKVEPRAARARWLAESAQRATQKATSGDLARVTAQHAARAATASDNEVRGDCVRVKAWNAMANRARALRRSADSHGLGGLMHDEAARREVNAAGVVSFDAAPVDTSLGDGQSLSDTVSAQSYGAIASSTRAGDVHAELLADLASGAQLSRFEMALLDLATALDYDGDPDENDFVAKRLAAHGFGVRADELPRAWTAVKTKMRNYALQRPDIMAVAMGSAKVPESVYETAA